MKTFALIFLLIFSVSVMGQKSENLRLPKSEEIRRIEISNTSAVNWYKPETLRRLLPKFVASPGTYFTKQPFQRGKFILKNGKTITWMANYTDSILLYDGSKEQLYIIPKQIPKPANSNPHK